MDDLRIYLKVKIKSLAAEAAIIRHEEAKNKKFKKGLADHRRGTVRYEARHTQLAYGFLRGKAYKDIEPKCHEKPNWAKVGEMIKKYGVYLEYDPKTKYSAYCQALEQLKEQQLKDFEQWKQGGNGSRTSL